MAGLALRPLLTWSAVSVEYAIAYDAVASMAIQYANVTGGARGILDGNTDAAASAAAAAGGRAASLSSPPPPSPSMGPAVVTLLNPLILGSLDGTYLSPNDTYGLVPPASPAAAGISAYVSTAGGWRAFQLDVANGEVVVEVAGCRGGLLEQLVVVTSTGRVWTTAIGTGLACSVPFRLVAPPGGYLIGMQVHAGSFVEELQLVWGTPMATQPAGGGNSSGGGSPPPHSVVVAANTGNDGERDHQQAVDIGIAVAVVVPTLAVALVVAVWWWRRSNGHGWCGRAGAGSSDLASEDGTKTISSTGPADSGGADGLAGGRHTGTNGNGGAAAAGTGSSGSDRSMELARVVVDDGTGTNSTVGTLGILMSGTGDTDVRARTLASSLGTGSGVGSHGIAGGSGLGNSDGAGACPLPRTIGGGGVSGTTMLVDNSGTHDGMSGTPMLSTSPAGTGGGMVGQPGTGLLGSDTSARENAEAQSGLAAAAAAAGVPLSCESGRVGVAADGVPQVLSFKRRRSSATSQAIFGTPRSGTGTGAAAPSHRTTASSSSGSVAVAAAAAAAAAATAAAAVGRPQSEPSDGTGGTGSGAAHGASAALRFVDGKTRHPAPPSNAPSSYTPRSTQSKVSDAYGSAVAAAAAAAAAAATANGETGGIAGQQRAGGNPLALPAPQQAIWALPPAVAALQPPPAPVPAASGTPLTPEEWAQQLHAALFHKVLYVSNERISWLAFVVPKSALAFVHLTVE